jgi:hypothetical protein
MGIRFGIRGRFEQGSKLRERWAGLREVADPQERGAERGRPQGTLQPPEMTTGSNHLLQDARDDPAITFCYDMWGCPLRLCEDVDVRAQ